MCGRILAAVGLVLVGASLPATAAGPPLGVARRFAVLGASTVMNFGPTIINGDLGLYPGTAITGFAPGVVVGGTIHTNDPTAMQAQDDAAVAYGVLEGMASLPANNLSGQDLGTLLLPLPPGVYKFDTSAQLTGGLILDAQGDSNALFVFQIGSTLTTASNATVVVINGGVDYDESNVFWQVGSSATLGSDTMFTGNILALQSITLVIGSQMVGNALALNAAVTLDSNTISSPVSTVPFAPEAPTNLTAAPVGGIACTGTGLSWTDASDNETDFRVYRKDGAGPFVLVSAIATTDMLGTGGVVTYQDPTLDSSTPFTYRVTASSPTAGESVPSNEVQGDTCVAPTRWLDVHLGRRRSVIRDRIRARTDRVVVRGSYAVIDMDTSVPSVVNDADPRADGIAIQVMAPGNLVLVSVPPNDPRWKVSKKGVYRWKTPKASHAPASSIMIDTRKSEFTLKSARNEFGSVPVNSITVSLIAQRATGSETRDWVHPETLAAGTRALFNLPR